MARLKKSASEQLSIAQYALAHSIKPGFEFTDKCSECGAPLKLLDVDAFGGSCEVCCSADEDHDYEELVF